MQISMENAGLEHGGTHASRLRSASHSKNKNLGAPALLNLEFFCTALFTVVLLLSASFSIALGATITVSINNEGTRDVFVTVQDMNTEPPETILNNRRINEHEKLDQLSITADGNSHGHLKWSATSTDHSHCGSGDKDDLGNLDILSVSASSGC